MLISYVYVTLRLTTHALLSEGMTISTTIFRGTIVRADPLSASQKVTSILTV